MSGQTVLHIACQHESGEMAKYLLGSGRLRLIMENDEGATLVHYACKSKQADLLECLVQSDHVDVDAYINKQNKHGETPLHNACAIGGIDVVRYMMESDEIGVDINVNVRSKIGNTPLHDACQGGEKEIIAYLLELDELDASPEVISPNRAGNSLLHLVCNFGTRDAVSCLMESHRIDINSILGIDDHGNGTMQNNQGDTPLHIILRSWMEADAVEFLINHDRTSTSIQLRTQNNRGDTPFHLACYQPSSSERIFRLLMEFNQLNSNVNTDIGSNSDINNINANICIDDIFNIQNNHGDTPLHIACLKGGEDFIEEFLQSRKADASLNIQNNDGDTPLHIAFNERMFFTFNHAVRLRHVFDFIQQQIIPTTNLANLFVQQDNHHDIGDNDVSIIQRLMENATSIANIQNHDGTTPLHHACQNGDVSVVRDLIGCDSVDATLRNSSGDTALHCICKGAGRNADEAENEDESDDESDDGKMRAEMMKALVESKNVKVDVSMTNDEGDTALHCAVKDNCLEVAEYLMELDTINPYTRNKSGDTPLRCAQVEDRDGRMVALLESKMDDDVNVSNDNNDDDDGEAGKARTTKAEALSRKRRFGDAVDSSVHKK